jgi:H+/gluconate symporter-like permease
MHALLTEFLLAAPDAVVALANAAAPSAGAAPPPSPLQNVQFESINPIGLIAVVGGLLTGIVVAMTAIIAGILHNRAKEESRREIAAYVAEGSVSPEDAERIINAKIPN